jgi:hypothetical protein
MADRGRKLKRGFNFEGLIVGGLVCLIPAIDTFLFLRPDLERYAPRITGYPSLDSFLLAIALDFVLLIVYFLVTQPRSQQVDWPNLASRAALSAGFIVLVVWLGLFVTSLFARPV